jgi:hypothetical protein
LHLKHNPHSIVLEELEVLIELSNTLQAMHKHTRMVPCMEMLAVAMTLFS